MSPISRLCEKIISNESFKEDFRLLENTAAIKRIVNQNIDIPNIAIEKLLLQSSVFAFSETISHKHIAQKVLSILHEFYPENNLINYAIQIICARLGNFPVVGIESDVFRQNNLFQKIINNKENDFIIDPDIASGLIMEEAISHFEINGKEFHFNIYQNDILKALEEKTLISFSAPTSFGKSFIVRHYIARRYASETIKRCLIIVPTKSLIDDFFEDFILIKKNLNLNFSIYTHARSIEKADDKSIFILTQERLSFLINQNPDFIKSFDLVYCDEAHSISRGYRGFVLRDVIRNLIILCTERDKSLGETKYIFSSPIIKNPDYYQKKLFMELDDTQTYHKEIQYSPVEKNIHIVEKKNDKYIYYLLHDNLSTSLYEERLEEIFRKDFPLVLSEDVNNFIERDIHIVLNSNLKGRTIFFTTSPISAHKYALLLSEHIDNKEQFNDEINDLSKYIRDHFDSSFGIAELLKKGIGLHYGPMPIGLRRAMVRLFEKGALDYLICTPTLLEGVNLPAKNIFLFSDKYGGKTGKEKHNALSFWNLLGRAGRITFGLSGNVYCLEKNISKYEELFESKDVEIKDPENEVIDDKIRRNYLVNSFLGQEEKDSFDYLRSTSRDDIEYLIFELLTKKDPHFLLGYFEEDIRSKILQKIDDIKSTFHIPNSLVILNSGIDPRLQNNLYIKIESLGSTEIEQCFDVISNPLALESSRLASILSQISINLKWPKEENVERTANRLTQWLHELPINGFIQQRLRHFAAPTDIASKIQYIEEALNVVRSLESEFSYKSPKYFKCFFDMIIYVAKQKGIDTKIYSEKVESFLFNLECGISSLVGKYLYEKGVTRPVAIKTNSLVEDMVTIPIDDDFFINPDVASRLRSGLSSIAYKELMDHLSI